MPKFTKTYIDSLKVKDKPYEVWDTDLKGLGVMIHPSNRKTYYFLYRYKNSKKERLKIGVHGNITCEIAREIVRGWAGDLARGINPKDNNKKQEAEAKQSVLFVDFWQVFTDKYMAEHHKPSTIKAHKSRIKSHIMPFFSAKKIGEIERRDILTFKDLLSDIKGNCAKCLRLLTTAFDQAELWGYRDQNSNPCKGVTRQSDKKMERFLSDDELKILEQALTDYAITGATSAYTIPAFRLLIYTGCRLGEVLKLKWEEVDLKNNCLRLKDSKTGERVIPLNNIAKEIVLGTIKKEDNPYVFCGNKCGSHLRTLQKTWERIREKAGISDVRIHDLRHSFASFAINNADLDLVHVQKLLGHKDIRTTLRYVHLTNKKLLDSTNRIFKA